MILVSQMNIYLKCNKVLFKIYIQYKTLLPKWPNFYSSIFKFHEQESKSLRKCGFPPGYEFGS